jgi:hypothetical protein
MAPSVVNQGKKHIKAIDGKACVFRKGGNKFHMDLFILFIIQDTSKKYHPFGVGKSVPVPHEFQGGRNGVAPVKEETIIPESQSKIFRKLHCLFILT